MPDVLPDDFIDIPLRAALDAVRDIDPLLREAREVEPAFRLNNVFMQGFRPGQNVGWNEVGANLGVAHSRVNRPIPTQKKVEPKYEIEIQKKGNHFVVSLYDRNKNNYVLDSWYGDDKEDVIEAVASFHKNYLMRSASKKVQMDIRATGQRTPKGHLTREERQVMRKPVLKDEVDEDSFALTVEEDIETNGGY